PREPTITKLPMRVASVCKKTKLSLGALSRSSLNEAMQHLSEREKRIVNLRFFEGKTQTEVSTEIGISQAQVSRLEKSALQHMRKYV
ncbi:MAG: sigma-70 family RNA polymerase sigma factor, partial [Anaerotignum sp.]|nr:sigma-70 family RNA polymerase sigma factor [Anaerotignum sp.]